MKLFSIAIFISVAWIISPWKPFSLPVPSVTSQKTEANVGLTIFFPDNVATFSGISAYTALDALQEKVSIETKKYDFGTLVTKVGKIENTPSHAWLYWVNGKEATISSDRYNLTTGDVVEWKYFSLSEK